MDHVYKNMQPHPYQKDQMPFGPYYYPGIEAVPAQMYVNPPRPPVNYGCCPWGSNCGYPSPIGCHGCCNHIHPRPHYAWGSPYSHVPPFHYPANYPPFPVHHMPSYGVEQPRNDYDKNMMNDHHCCWCSNHPFHAKEHNNVRVEEEEPEKERRKNDSLVPFQLKNTPYPIVWLPPDYSNNNEQQKAKDWGDSKDGSVGVKARESGKTAEQKPTLWNGWHPLDLNNLVSSKHRGDGEINHQQNDGKGSSPFPLFWIPNYKPDEEGSEEHKVSDSIMESQNDSGNEQSFLATRGKDTPLKEGKRHEEKESAKNQEKETYASVKQNIGSNEKKLENGEKKLPNKGAKGKSASPSKSSKLPPVCLRVDPLPRRKTANGSSSSPSPPGDKQKPDAPSNKPSTVLNLSDNKEPDTGLRNEFKEKKGTKTIEVVDGNIQKQQNVVVNLETPIKVPTESQDDVPTNQKQEMAKRETISTDAAIKGQSEDVGSAPDKNEELFRGEEVVADEAKKSRKIKLSEEEAAAIIQSAYRGFDTRKWEPVKKLKQMAKVTEEMANVKHLIQEMEKSTSDVDGSGKQRNIIAETIMSLLLKLDAIQGLHPSVREIRKLLVRELISLQEMLDSATKNIKSENSLEEESVMKHDDDDSIRDEDVIPTESGNETPSDSLEAHQNHENTEITEAIPVGEEMIDKLENEAAESCRTKNSESATESIITNEDKKNNEVLETDVKVTDSEQTDCHKLETDLAELPQGVSDDPCVHGNINRRDVDTYASEAGPTKQLEEGVIEAPVTSDQHTSTADEESKENVEIHEVSDLPLSDVKVELEAEVASPINESSSCNKIGGDARFEPDLGEAKLEGENGNLEQERILIDDPGNTHEKADHMTGEVKEVVVVEDKCEDGRIDSGLCSSQTNHTIVAADNDYCGGVSPEAKPKVAESCDVENEGSVYAPPGVTYDEAKDRSVSLVDPTLPQVSLTRDDMYENNIKLIEENQRLRDMMQKMMKSGQEQLTAISSLSGRVKDLERRLSRKKKLKLRPKSIKGNEATM